MNELKQPLVDADYRGKNVVFITGAGMSVGAGIPCYWGEEGVYTELENRFGRPIDQVLSASNFKSNPSEVWEYMANLFVEFKGVEPTQAYKKIAALEELAKNCFIYTQNCDGLHLKSGSKNVAEIHGSAEQAVCTQCSAVDRDFHSKLGDSGTPKCDRCDGVLKPDVVLFEEYPKLNLPEALYRCQSADLVIVVGTQAYFSYVTDMFNNAALTRSRIIFVDICEPEQIVNNPFVNNSVIETLEYYTGGAERFFAEMMPELNY